MAKNINSANISQPVGGMNTDSPFQTQVKNSIRFGLNSVLSTKDGDKFTRRSIEEGNKVSYNLPLDFIPIGKRYIGNGKTALFLVKKDETVSEIGIGYSDGRYETHVNDFLSEDKLNFRLHKQIDVVYNQRRGCEDVVYFTDDYSEPRTFNFSKPYNYKDEDGNWAASRFRLIKYPTLIPSYENISVLNSGGSLSPGSYNVVIQLLDEDFNPTEWIADSQVIHIYNDLTTRPFLEISGSVNSLEEGFNYPDTSKAIEVIVSNLDTDFSYYRLGFIEASAGLGTINKVRYSQALSIEQKKFIYTGTNFESEGTTEEILFFNERIYKAKHIAQVDNILMLGDTKGNDIDYCMLQKYASQITVDCFVQEVVINNLNDPRSPKNPTHALGDMELGGLGYMPGEIYAFAIVYAFDDGSFSPAYHIPGKSPLVSDNHIFSPDTGVHPMSKNNTSSSNFYRNSNSCSDTGSTFWGLDSQNTPLTGSRVRHHRFPFRSDINAPLVQDASTSGPNEQTLYKLEIKGEGTLVTPCTQEMIDAGECDTLVNAPDFVVTVLYSVEGIEYSTSIFVNPLDWIDMEDFVSIRGESNYYGTQNIVINSIREDGVDVAQGVVSPKGLVYNIQIKDILYTSEVKLYKTNLLGAKFSNVIYPNEAELKGKKVTGYYIVRGERGENDKTILDTGVLTPCLKNKKYVAQGLLNPEIAADKTLISKRVFGLISPEHKFHGREYSSFSKLKIEGSFDVIETKKSNIRYDDVQDGSSFDGKYHKKGNPDGYPEDNDPNGRGMDGWSWQCIVRDNILSYTSKAVSVEIPFEDTEEIFYLDALGNRDVDNGATSVYNIAADNKVGIIQFREDLTWEEGSLPYVVLIRENLDPYSNYRTMPYYKDSLNLLTGPVNKVLGGDTTVSSMRYVNTMFWENRVAKRAGKTSAWKTIAGVALVIVGAVLAFFTGGASTIVVGAGIALLGAGALYVASGIKQAAIMKAYGEAYDRGLRETALDDFVSSYYKRADGPSDDEIQWIADCATDLFFDSSINMDLRIKIDGDTPSYLPSPGKVETGNYTIQNTWEYFGLHWVPSDPKYPISDLEFHIAKKLLAFEPNRDDSRAYLGIPLGELYRVNADYERKNKEKVFTALGEEYDCCSDCKEVFSQRIHYSVQSFAEELSDSFRVFLPNNYKDITGESGIITNLFTINNDLYVHTEEALYKLPRSYQERVTDEIVSFIGTGSVFESPAIKILDDDTGNSAGTTHKWGAVKTPNGYAFVSERQGKIFLLSGQGLKPISSLGLEKDFNKSIPVKLDKDFRISTLEEYPFRDNVSNPYGTGYILVYDSEYKRIIVTKKDSVIDPSFTQGSNLLLSQKGTELFVFENFETIVQNKAKEGFAYLGVDEDQLKFGKYLSGNYELSYVPGVPVETFKTDNLGWTMSFDLEQNVWVSYHSYMPIMYISTPNKLFSLVENDNRVWEHNVEGLYANFYGEKKPFIIEFVSNSDAITNKIYDSLKFYVEALKFDEETQEYFEVPNIFFNKIVAYNSKQGTGLMEIIPKSELETTTFLPAVISNTDLGVIQADYVEGFWNINHLRDYRVDYNKPMFDRNPINLQVDYYIDKVINTNVFNFNKSWTQLEPLRDKYLVVRLIFDKFDDVKLLMNFSIESETQSYR